MGQRVTQRDKSAKRMPQHRHLRIPKRLAQRLNIFHHRSRRKLFRRHALGAPIPTIIQIDQASAACQRRKPGHKLLMVQPWPTMQQETRRPVALFSVKEFHSIDFDLMLAHSALALLLSSWEEAGGHMAAFFAL